MEHLILVLILFIKEFKCDNFDVLIDAKATSIHRIDSLNLLIYCKSHRKSIETQKFLNIVHLQVACWRLLS